MENVPTDRWMMPNAHTHTHTILDLIAICILATGSAASVAVSAARRCGRGIKPNSTHITGTDLRIA